MKIWEKLLFIKTMDKISLVLIICVLTLLAFIFLSFIF